MGQSPDSNYVSDDPYVGYAFLQGNAEFGVVSPTPKFGCTRPAKLAKKGDVLISVRAPVGAVNVADRDYCIGRGLAAVRAPEIAPSLLAYLLSREAPALRKVAQGTTFEAIGKHELHSLRLTMPPENEFGLISSILDTLDTAIRETEAIIAKLKAVKQGLLHDLLTRGIDANGELRPPQAEAPHLYKESPLGWIPSRWNIVPLRDVLTVDLGFAFRSDDYVEDGLLSFRVTNIGRPADDFGGSVFLPPHFWSIYQKQQLVGGEIVIVMVGATTGKLGRVPPDVCPALQNQNMWRLTPRTGFDREFIWIALPDAVQRHMALAQGSARDFLTQSQFLETLIAAPCLDEQLKLVEAATALESRIVGEEAYCNELFALKSGLMDDLLAGRVRVTPLLPADE